ncbi:MAG TPA: proton-conducting transporter membrane subunit, partial [Candidatus Dormibacteraeota bacterium]|nr:proton-conducting transporter membrane subunit [Candidatus Dormibacteraeota bacterium]
DVTLSLVIFAPLVGAAVIWALPARTDLERFRVRVTALAFTLIPALIATYEFLGNVAVPTQGALPQPLVNATWVGGFLVSLGYHIGTDGVNSLPLTATAIAFPILVLASWRQRARPRLYFSLLLLIEVGVVGDFAARDLGLFLIFYLWPAVPASLLLGVFGGEGAHRAARRLLAVWLLGGACLFAGALLLAVRSGRHTFSLTALTTPLALPRGVGAAVFLLLLAAALARMALVPLHTWFVDALGTASPAVAMAILLSSVPVGGYTLIRVAENAAPLAAFHLATPVLAVALLSVFWGALGAYGERDLRRLVGYAVVSLSGDVALGAVGFSETSLAGSLYLCVAIALGGGLLLLVAGALAERQRVLRLASLRGCAPRAPRLFALWVVGMATAAGLPLLAGFPGLYQVFLGTFPGDPLGVAAALLGLLVLTIALWRGAGRTFLGTPDEGLERLRDAEGSEWYAAMALVVTLVVFGVVAGRFLGYSVNGTDLIAGRVAAVAPQPAPHHPGHGGTHK